MYWLIYSSLSVPFPLSGKDILLEILVEALLRVVAKQLVTGFA